MVAIGDFDIGSGGVGGAVVSACFAGGGGLATLMGLVISGLCHSGQRYLNTLMRNALVSFTSSRPATMGRSLWRALGTM